MLSVSVSYDVSVPSRPRIGVASRPTTRIRIPAIVIACSRKPRLANRSATRSPGVAGHQRRVRLVLQLGVPGRGDQVAVGVADRVERVDRAVGREGVGVDPAVQQAEVGPVVAPLRQLDVGVGPVRLGPHLRQEHRELAVEAGRAVAVVVHELG